MNAIQIMKYKARRALEKAQDELKDFGKVEKEICKKCEIQVICGGYGAKCHALEVLRLYHEERVQTLLNYVGGFR